MVLVDNRLIFRYQDGVVALMAANPKRYEPLGKFQQSVKSNNKSWAHPAVADNKLFLRENDKIMVYDLAALE